VAYWSTESLLETNDKVIHTYKVIENLDAILLLMVDNETGQRGFILTENADFLKPYELATPKIEKTLDRVIVLTKDNKDQQKRLEELHERLNVRLRYTADLVEMGKSDAPGKGFETAREKVKQAKGKKLMDDVRDK